ncbi:MAG: hypothetical protein MZV64_71485 [Ignavibacteriales bacterium]|nr:hypothetical protein [Ignavibacteriales bacterium]
MNSGKRSIGERFHHRQLVLQAAPGGGGFPACSPCSSHCVKGGFGRKVTAAPPQQALLQEAFERPVLGLHRAILFFLADRDGARFHPQVGHQLQILAVELPLAGADPMGGAGGVDRSDATPALSPTETGPLECPVSAPAPTPSDSGRPIASWSRARPGDTATARTVPPAGSAPTRRCG